MKVVKCVHESDLVSLTKGKIYDVINYDEGCSKSIGWVRIVNDDGNQEFYYLKDTDGTWFVDATPLIREQKLKELGI